MAPFLFVGLSGRWNSSNSGMLSCAVKAARLRARTDPLRCAPRGCLHFQTTHPKYSPGRIRCVRAVRQVRILVQFSAILVRPVMLRSMNSVLGRKRALLG